MLFKTCVTEHQTVFNTNLEEAETKINSNFNSLHDPLDPENLLQNKLAFLTELKRNFEEYHNLLNDCITQYKKIFKNQKEAELLIKKEFELLEGASLQDRSNFLKQQIIECSELIRNTTSNIGNQIDITESTSSNKTTKYKHSTTKLGGKNLNFSAKHYSDTYSKAGISVYPTETQTVHNFSERVTNSRNNKRKLDFNDASETQKNDLKKIKEGTLYNGSPKTIRIDYDSKRSR